MESSSLVTPPSMPVLDVPAQAENRVPPTPGRIERAARPQKTPQLKKATGSLFRVIWRWHFYAGIVVSPFLIVLAVTGALYIFKYDIENWTVSHLRYVAPAGEKVGYQKQVEAAAAAHPDWQVSSLEVPVDPTRTTVVQMRQPAPPTPPGDKPAPGGRGPRGKFQNVYVNPYTAEIVGTSAGGGVLSDFFAAVLKIHRNLFVGATGRVVTELATGWSIILFATGLYLWWPRKSSKVAGVWNVRWKAKLYTRLRDLHALSGVYLFPIAFTIAVTGMFYTQVVGKVIHDAAHYVMEEPEEPAAKPEGKAGGGKAAEGRGGRDRSGPPAPALASFPLDAYVANIKQLYPDRSIFISVPFRRREGAAGDALQVSAGNDFNNTYGRFVSTQFDIDPKTAQVVSQKHLSEGGHFWHGWTYPLHVGSVYGPTTKVLWLVACLALVALPVTGLWMWWKRRPKGQIGLPRKPDVRLPWALVGLVAVLSVVMPVVGASVLLFLAAELAAWTWRRLRPATV